MAIPKPLFGSSAPAVVQQFLVTGGRVVATYPPLLSLIAYFCICYDELALRKSKNATKLIFGVNICPWAEISALKRGESAQGSGWKRLSVLGPEHGGRRVHARSGGRGQVGGDRPSILSQSTLLVPQGSASRPS